MEVQIIETVAQFRELELYWSPLLENCGSNTIFLTYEWFDAYLNTIAEFNKLSTIVVKDDERILGIAPLMIQKREGFHLLSLIGHEVLDYEDFLIHPEKRTETLEAIFATLLKMKDWHLFQINKLLEDSPNFTAFQKFAAKNHAICRPFSVAPYLEVTGDFETYWNSLKKSFRGDIRRRARKMEQERGKPQFALAKKPIEQKVLFEILMDFHIRRRIEHKGDYSFFTRPERRAFYEFVIDKMSKNKRLHFSQLQLDKKTVAVHLGFKHNGCFYYYIPTFDMEYEKYAVGYSLLKELLRDSFNNGCQTFDFLLGAESYKSRFTHRKRHLYSFTIFSNSMMGKVAKAWWGAVRERLRTNSLFMRLVPYLYKANILKTNT